MGIIAISIKEILLKLVNALLLWLTDYIHIKHNYCSYICTYVNTCLGETKLNSIESLAQIRIEN